jgi:hypothetical protein
MNPKDVTETPEVDAETFDVYDSDGCDGTIKRTVVEASYARKLEKERDQWKAMAEELASACDKAMLGHFKGSQIGVTVNATLTRFCEMTTPK